MKKIIVKFKIFKMRLIKFNIIFKIQKIMILINNPN